MSTTAVNFAKTPLRVLIIEDYEEDAMLLERQLARAGYAVEALRIETERQLVDALGQREPWHLVLADYTVPSFGAREALALLQQSGADLPFIIVSGTIDEVSAVDAMRAGAHDYVLKGHLERLLPAIERELSDARRRQQRLRTEAELRVAQQPSRRPSTRLQSAWPTPARKAASCWSTSGWRRCFVPPLKGWYSFASRIFFCFRSATSARGSAPLCWQGTVQLPR